jgi:predicted metalloprotease with PDZ domain
VHLGGLDLYQSLKRPSEKRPIVIYPTKPTVTMQVANAEGEKVFVYSNSRDSRIIANVVQSVNLRIATNLDKMLQGKLTLNAPVTFFPHKGVATIINGNTLP